MQVEHQSPPPFTKLLGILHPEFMIPDLDSLRVAIGAAVDCGLIEAEDCNVALAALLDACRFAAPDIVDPAVREVDFRRKHIHDLASELLFDIDPEEFTSQDTPEAYASSKFFACLGRVPDEVKLRMKCAAARSGLASIMSASAVNHLVAAVMELAARVPGARITKTGDVTWPYIADVDNAPAALAWLSLPGPGVFSKRRIDGITP